MTRRNGPLIRQIQDGTGRLSPQEKKVVSKVLTNKGMSLRDVGALLGLSAATIMRYAKLKVPEELKQFETEIQEAFKTRQDLIAAKALVRMENQIATATINEALDVYESMRGKKNGGATIMGDKVIAILGDWEAE